jgi:NAD(P)-dependent dehydrogenase (short-subunit alcohol dehydrogenase family)
MAGTLENKVAVITGGTTGIGLATAQRFVDEGARVVVTGTNPETIAEARRLLGSGAEVLASDATSSRDVEQLLASVRRDHGPIDVLFLNAGIARFAPWQDHDEDEFDAQFAVNVKGPWLAIKHALPVLADGASIIVTTSVVNRMGMPGSGI